MGVDGFLRQLKEAVDDTHLRQFAGQTLVVDALSWLHKACYGCAFDLSTGRVTDTYVRYMLRKVDMMRRCGVAKVILVFDGQRLPLKASTHEKRQSLKEENRKRALASMAASKRLQGVDRQVELKQAYQHFQRSVSVTSEVISNVMNALRAAKVPFVVAPFEADAQMVWMCKEGMATGIVTEDSDVVVYCLTANIPSPVLVKLDDNGSAQAVSRSIIHKNSKASSNALLKKMNFLTSGEKEATRMLVQVCVLAGCDFIDSLPNMGFATAVKHIFNFRGAPGHLRVQRLVSKLSSGGTKIPADFMERFVKAEAIFFHHIIFNPKRRSCEFLINARHSNCFADVFQLVKESLGIAALDESEPSSTAQQQDLHASTSMKSFLGCVHSREIVEGIYNGDVNPRMLRSSSENATASQSGLQHSTGQLSTCGVSNNVVFSSDVGDVSSADDAFPNDIEEGLSVHTTRREHRPDPVMTAQQIESRIRSQAHERETSLHRLVNIYQTSASADSQILAGNKLKDLPIPASHSGSTNKSCSVENVLSKPSPVIKSLTMSERILTTTAVKTTKGPATSMKELIAKHSRSSQTSSSPVSSESKPKAMLQSAPESKKRPRPVTKPLATSARKLHQKTGSKSNTLLHFFRKQG